MAISNPDDLLVDTSDWLASIPQQAGVNLARLRRVIPCLVLATLAAGVLNLVLREEAMMVFIWSMPAGMIAPGMWKAQARYAADGLRWSPKLAQEYRARAVTERASHATRRILLTLVTVGYVALSVRLAMLGHGLSLGESWPMLATLSLLCLNSYARCTFPHDPDLRGRVPSPT